MYFTTNASHLQAHMTCWVYMGDLVYYLAVQQTGDVAYKLSDLGLKRIILYESPALTFFERHSY